MQRKKLFCSFSGGETSALMTHKILTRWRDRYETVVVLFANTSQENDATLDFVRRCDEHFGFNTVWVEAKVREHGGTEHTVVTFETAKRNGEIFEKFIDKYGIPNYKFPQCTRELKLRPIRSYLRSLGWLPSVYDTAIGIRADELQRRAKNAVEKGVVYPLIDWSPHTKTQVNAFWNAQNFRLDLTGYQGNCKTCWKKSFRKLLTVMDETPHAFDFFERMEQTKSHIGAEFLKPNVPEGYKRVFFRGNKSVADLRAVHAAGAWSAAENDAVLYDNTHLVLDLYDPDGCAESCEINF